MERTKLELNEIETITHLVRAKAVEPGHFQGLYKKILSKLNKMFDEEYSERERVSMILSITPEQEQIIIDALRDRIGKLYDMSEQYKSTNFTECQKDCLDEKKKVQELLDTFIKK